MYKLKVAATDGSPIYLDLTDTIRITSEGRAFAYIDGRSQALELDAKLMTAERYERVLFRQVRYGYVPLVDMTQPGRLVYIKDPSEPQIDLDPTPQPKAAETLDYDLVQVAMDALK